MKSSKSTCCEKCKSVDMIFNRSLVEGDGVPRLYCKDAACECHQSKTPPEGSALLGRESTEVPDSVHQPAKADLSIVPPPPSTAEGENWKERFQKQFCRTDKSPEQRGYMMKWFLRDDITALEMLAFIAAVRLEAIQTTIDAHETERTKYEEEAKEEGAREVVEKIKGRIGFLRQWLNEKPKDMLVENTHIEKWLEI